MKTIDLTVRDPVKRAHAEDHLLITLLVFAASVIATRVFLQITGYPRLGNDILHIAHALWGGLFLMISAILPIVLANRWVINLSAVLNGLGIGLFIDELGKFITANNDYFYPPAAPLIYALFLMLVLVYFIVRRPKKPEPRSALYHALTDLQELADNNLDQMELDLLLKRLSVAKKSQQPHVAGLASVIDDYLQTSEVSLVPTRPIFSKKLAAWMQNAAKKIGRAPSRLIILVIMSVMAFNVVYSLCSLVWAAVSPAVAFQDFMEMFLTRAGIIGTSIGIWHVIRLILEIVIGLLMLISVVLIFHRNEYAGMHIGMIALLLSLTGLLLLSFYLDQFGALRLALVQFPFLLILIAYRRWYLYPPEV